MNPFVAKINRRLKDFAAARDGNVAVTFAIALLPLLGFAGAAVDYSHAGSARVAMQSALDATALMLSKDAATLTTTELKTKGTAFFTALFNQKDSQILDIAPVYTATGGSTLTVTGSIKVKTDFMGVLGIKDLTIGSTSVVKWGNTRMRVALALDNTGSMASDGKMTALKTATKNLLAQLKASATVDGDVLVSMIPFGKDVNVGASNYNQTWVDWEDWDDDNGHDASTQTCTSSKVGKSGKTKKKCTTTTSWVPDNHNTWNGCVTDRDQDYDIKNTTPTSDSATMFPADQYNSCPVSMMGLGYNWTAMNSKVDAMIPVGTTNQPIGLAWAWQSLSPGAPLNAPAMDPNYTYQRVIILMSDGLNTEDRWYDGWGAQSQIDARMAKICTNVKAAGITIWAIHVNTDNDPISTVLQNCASDSSKFFMLTSANSLIATFNQIGSQLSQLRIAQ
ncbi:MAG: Flp pilus assembly protein TadG [Xanthobacteraceae bacterium]|nr:Flp pilus assembly protein TadG [Xanthobacteraceae bacterium]